MKIITKVSLKSSFSKILTPLCLDELLKSSKILKFKKNDRIFNEGSVVEGIYFINSGNVKVVSYFNSVDERIMRLSSAGDILGHRGLSTLIYPVSGIALTNTEVTFIPIDVFLKAIEENPKFAVYIINFLINDLKNTEERMKSMIHNDVIVRLGTIICMLIDAYGFEEENPKKLHYTLPRADMANMAGTTYESIIRNLAKLEEQKMIKLDNKSIIILKEKSLRKLFSLL